MHKSLKIYILGGIQIIRRRNLVVIICACFIITSCVHGSIKKTTLEPAQLAQLPANVPTPIVSTKQTKSVDVDVEEPNEELVVYNNPIDSYFIPHIENASCEAERREYQDEYKDTWKLEFNNIIHWMNEKCLYSEDRDKITEYENNVQSLINLTLSVVTADWLGDYKLPLDSFERNSWGNATHSARNQIEAEIYRDAGMHLIGYHDEYNFLYFDSSEEYIAYFSDVIDKSMPVFHFEVQGYKVESGYSYQATKITISCEDRISQEIVFDPNALKGTPISYSEDFGFQIEDMNFDGYKDISIVQNVGGPNIRLLCWIWDVESQQFKEDYELGKIISPEFDQEKELIYSFARGSAADHFQDTYQYIDGKLTLIKSIATGYVNDEDPENTYYIEYQLIDGEWKLIEKKTYELKG